MDERFTAIVKSCGQVAASAQTCRNTHSPGTGLFGERNEFQGRHHAALWMMPANERFEARDASRQDIDEGLVAQLEPPTHLSFPIDLPSHSGTLMTA
jgi:hypothetical protein